MIPLSNKASSQGQPSDTAIEPSQVELRLYVGRFAAPTTGRHERAIREWAARQQVGVGPIGVYGLGEVVDAVRSAASSKTYRDNPVLVTMKVLDAAGLLLETDTAAVGSE